MRPQAFSVVAALLLTSTSAHAFRPQEGLRAGAEPVRVREVHPSMQDYLSRTHEGWSAFLSTAGEGWEVVFDEASGTPHRMWGPGLELGRIETDTDVKQAVSSLVEGYPDLFGVEGDQWRFRSVASMEEGATWYADVDVLVQGEPVWRSGLTFRFRNGNLVMMGADTYPEAPRLGEWALASTDAEDRFLNQGPPDMQIREDRVPRRVWLPMEAGGKVSLRAVWELYAETKGQPAQWVGFVDADSGQLLAFYNEVRFVSGQLNARVDLRAGEGIVERPLPLVTIEAPSEDVFTAEDGSYELTEETDTVDVDLRGPYAILFDQIGRTDIEGVGLNDTITADDVGGTQAGLSTYYHVHKVREFASNFAPEVLWTQTGGSRQVSVTVNRDGNCNAYFDGTLNFLRAGDGCANTGRLPDVVYHEWGHGFHQFSLVSGFYDGSLGEGAADTLSSLMTGDHRLAPGFFSANTNPLRDVLNTRSWPEDFLANDQYIHSNGLIFGGSMWDTRKELEKSYSEEEATTILAGIFATMLKGGPDIETSYFEAVFADDDDGDLGNGTPHQCEIIAGFGAHGLGPVGGFGIQGEHENPVFAPPEDVSLQFDIGNPAPTCLDLEPERGQLVYRVDGGEWTIAGAEVDPAGFEVDLSNTLSKGSFVEYYLQAELTNGAMIMDPPGGKIRPYTFYVGDVLEVNCEDFETSSGDYTSQLVSGEQREGADDWMWGFPQGFSGDAPSAYSGERAWGNDFGGGEYNGAYQGNIHNRLTSPELDLKHYQGGFLQYMRWLTVEDSVFDQANILANGTQVWSSHGSSPNEGGEHHLDDRWAAHVVDLGDLEWGAPLELSWELISDGGLEFGGWNIDDVCIYAPATADNRMGISDLDATREDNGPITFTWTNPQHAPLEKVRLVRTAGGFPSGADAGTVVFETDSPEVGGRSTYVYEEAKRNGFYAVYGYDGEQWLSWTKQGWNALAVSADGVVAVDDDAGALALGCGCSSSPAGTSGGLVLLTLGLVGLRRREERD